MEIKETATDKIRDIEQRISALSGMRDALRELVRTDLPQIPRQRQACFSSHRGVTVAE